MTDTTAQQNPAEIERDIRRTQEDMSRTVNRIGDQLTARNLVNALLDKAESNDIDARKILDVARRKPLALAMLAGGAIWLVSDADAKLPSFGSGKEQANGHSDPQHRDYISHMASVEMRDGEDPLSYQRRRDTARSNYLMVERRHDEDEGSFRQRLDDAAEKFRAQRQALSEQTQRAGAALSETSRAAVSRTRDLYNDNPLPAGLIAAAVGALIGSAVPITATEQEQLSAVGQKAVDLASEQKDKLVDKAKEQKDQLVAAVQESVRPGAQAQTGSDTPTSTTPRPGQPASA